MNYLVEIMMEERVRKKSNPVMRDFTLPHVTRRNPLAQKLANIRRNLGILTKPCISVYLELH